MGAQRITWVDALRGLGMILVVSGHALDGLETAFGEQPAITFSHDLIYTFHMPLFFFLSGQFSSGALKLAPLAFAGRIGSRIIYPYVLWSLVHIGVSIVLSGVTNHATAASEVFSFWWMPVAVYWFLQTLLVAFVLAYLIQRAPRAAIAALASAMIGVGIIYAWAVHVPPEGVNELVWAFVYRLGAMPGFFLLGMICPIADWEKTARNPVLVAVAAAVAVYVIVQVARGAAWLDPIVSLPAPFAFTLLFTQLSMALGAAGCSKALSAIGRASIAIFTAHLFFVAGARVALVKAFGDVNWLAALPVCIIAGIVFPFIAYRIADATRTKGLLGWR